MEKKKKIGIMISDYKLKKIYLICLLDKSGVFEFTIIFTNYTNPSTNKQLNKRSILKKVENYFFGKKIHKNRIKKTNSNWIFFRMLGLYQ